MSTASALDLTIGDAIVLHDSNKLALRLLPCDVLARVAPVAHQVAQFEVDLAQRLTETESPVAALEPRVEPRVYARDGFVVTLWTYYEPLSPREVSPADYANALERLHDGMRKIDVTTPHFTDRVAEAQQLVAGRDRTPALADADRELLSHTLRNLRRAIGDRGAVEQLLHGEPHQGNVLRTKNGPLFIDLETCCRAPPRAVPEALRFPVRRGSRRSAPSPGLTLTYTPRRRTVRRSSRTRSRREADRSRAQRIVKSPPASFT